MQTTAEALPVVMRARPVVRIGLPVVAMILAALGPRVGWSAWLLSAVAVVQCIASFRGYVRIQGGTIFRRGVLRWYQPLPLSTVRDVTLARQRVGKGLTKRLELWLTPAGGRPMTFSILWWTNTDDLLRLVAEAASEPAGDQLHRRQWRLDLDAETRQRLALYT